MITRDAPIISQDLSIIVLKIFPQQSQSFLKTKPIILNNNVSRKMLLLGKNDQQYNGGMEL